MKKSIEYVHPSELELGNYEEVTSYEQYVHATHFTFLPGEDGWDEVKYYIKR